MPGSGSRLHAAGWILLAGAIVTLGPFAGMRGLATRPSRGARRARAFVGAIGGDRRRLPDPVERTGRTRVRSPSARLLVLRRRRSRIAASRRRFARSPFPTAPGAPVSRRSRGGRSRSTCLGDAGRSSSCRRGGSSTGSSRRPATGRSSTTQSSSASRLGRGPHREATRATWRRGRPRADASLDPVTLLDVDPERAFDDPDLETRDRPRCRSVDAGARRHPAPTTRSRTHPMTPNPPSRSGPTPTPSGRSPTSISSR